MVNARHFQPGPKLSDEVQFENFPHISRPDDDGFDAGLADDTCMDGGQAYDLDDKPVAVDPSIPDIMGF